MISVRFFHKADMNIYCFVLAVQPAKFHSIVRHWLNEGIQDLSVSRQRDRLGWGIPVPDDPSQTVSTARGNTIFWEPVNGLLSSSFSTPRNRISIKLKSNPALNHGYCKNWKALMWDTIEAKAGTSHMEKNIHVFCWWFSWPYYKLECLCLLPVYYLGGFC